MTKDALELLGFVDVGNWQPADETIAFKLDGEHVAANKVRMDTPNALYAFVRNDAVQYIGKTTRSVRKRFVGYRNPGQGQRTNLRCNSKIKEALADGGEIRVLIFTPISDLRYGNHEINLAAGLEDALIKAFDPPWNGRDKDKPITEEAEREKAEEKADSALAAEEPERSVGRGAEFLFTVTLGQAYYQQGLINPGVAASQYLGADGEPLQVLFDDGSEPVLSSINRTANRTGAVRVIGRNRQIAEWFRANFQPGDVVNARVLDPNRIILSGKRKS